MDNNKKLDKILEDIGDMKVLLERHTVLHETNTRDLTHHIKRTDQNEEMIEELRQKQHALELSIAVKESFLKGNWKALTLVGSILVALVTMAKHLGLI